MNIRDIRIQLETVLTDVLGTYHLANGATTPAIAVRAAGESLPPGTTVDGLEVVIVRDPEPVLVPQYRQETAGDRWTLYLVDWSGDTPLQTVAGRLIWAYPGSNAVLINVPRGVGPGAQMRVDLQTKPNAAIFNVDTNYPQESVKYQVLVDANTAGTIYVGKAPEGVQQSAARWTITRSTYSPAGIRTSKGTATAVTWTGRTSHTYA